MMHNFYKKYILTLNYVQVRYGVLQTTIISVVDSHFQLSLQLESERLKSFLKECGATCRPLCICIQCHRRTIDSRRFLFVIDDHRRRPSRGLTVRPRPNVTCAQCRTSTYALSTRATAVHAAFGRDLISNIFSKASTEIITLRDYYKCLHSKYTKNASRLSSTIATNRPRSFAYTHGPPAAAIPTNNNYFVSSIVYFLFYNTANIGTCQQASVDSTIPIRCLHSLIGAFDSLFVESQWRRKMRYGFAIQNK